MSSTEKIINLDLLAFYDGKIKEYIDGKTTSGNGVAIYDNYSKLPTDLTEDTIAYCENDYIDNTDVNNPIIYSKGLYFYNTDISKWENTSVYSETLDDKVDKEEGKGLSTNDYTDEDKNKIDSIDLDNLMTVDVYASTENENSVKNADNIINIESAQPLSYYGKNTNGDIGFHYFPINDGSLPAGEMEQRRIINAIAEHVYSVDSVNDLSDSKIYIQCFKSVQGAVDVIFDITQYNSSQTQKLLYNNDIVDINDDHISIKTEYTINNTRTDDYYQSDEIDKSKFKSLINIIQE